MSSLPKQPPPPSVDFYFILNESKRILSAHRRHFLELSVFFLYSLPLLNNIYLTLSSQFNHHSQSPTNANTAVSIPLPLIYEVLGGLAAGTISFGVYHIFVGRRHPVKLVSSILSLLRSFFLPLSSTSLASLLLHSSLTFLAFGFLLFLITGFELAVFKINQSCSPSNFLFLSSLFIMGLLLLVLVLIYLKVSWALASIIAVVESSCGFEPPLRRGSTKLMVFNGICSGALVIIGCSLVGDDDEFDGDIRSWKSWLFVSRTVVSTGGVMLLIWVYFVANRVLLYMYCKAVYGEEVDGEYVSLPSDDGKSIM